MPLPGRILAIVALLAVAGFCVFGFLASYESPGYPGWRAGYALAGIVCLAGVAWLIVRRKAGC